MTAASNGRVLMKPAALLRCPMVPQVERWVRNSVEPASLRYFGSRVVEMRVAASYACRPINHRRGAKLSEHGYANALDVSRFHARQRPHDHGESGLEWGPRRAAFLARFASRCVRYVYDRARPKI